MIKQITFRLKPGQLLKEEIEQTAIKYKIKAGALLSIVGGLENAVLRMGGSEPENQIIKEWSGPFEIVSGTGTISDDGCHIHISISDQAGQVFGGHLKDDCMVKYTAEIVLAIFDDVTYKRVLDKETGFGELTVEKII